MKYTSLIFSVLSAICSILLAIHCSFNNQNNETIAWGVCSIWIVNCLIHELKDFKNGN